MKSKKMRFLSLAMSFLVLFGSASVLSSCAEKEAPMPPEGTYTRMTVDINPSVEFMVDDQNKVVSATALNDDGSILIAGEAFVGKTPEEAVEMVVSLANDTGYLVKGSVEVGDNTVKISISGNSEYADYLRDKIDENVQDFLKKHDIEGKVERLEAKALDAMRNQVVADGLFTEEEVAEMDEQQLYRALAAGRVETALLLTEELRQTYYRAREYKISFAEREATVKIIDGMGNAYLLMRTAYSTALDAYSQTIVKLDDLRYELLISPESEYQKSLAALRDAKEELLKEKNYVASLEVGSELYLSATATLKISEEDYNRALAAYEKLGEQANAAMESLITLMRSGEQALIELENKFPEEIKTKLTENAKELEDAANRAKDSFFAEFEAAHKDDIQSITDALVAKKQQLIEDAKNPTPGTTGEVTTTAA